MRKIALVAMLSALMLGLAGCDAIPSSGPVREGLGRLDQVERGVQFNPVGPQAGASQEDIIRGFVRAGSSSLNDYEVAREYLAPVYSEQWDPSLGVLVDEGTHEYSFADENVGTLRTSLVANVDGAGTLTLAEPDFDTEVKFELVRVGGEWRIASAPAGIILDKSTFSAVWSPRSVYYLSGDDRLVADVKWFINRSNTLSTQIVRELLRGPSSQMVGALRTAFPEGTSLSVESVPVIDGTAVIDVTSEVLDIDNSAMQLLLRQIAYSLPSTLRDFELSVHGTVIQTAPVASADDSSASENQFVAVMREGKFGTLSVGGVQPIEGLSERINELSGVTGVSLSPDRTAAAVNFSGGVAWVYNEEIVVVDERRNLLVPGLDALGFVWTYDPANPSVIEAGRPGGFESVLSTGWLDVHQIKAARVSTAGNHLALLVEDKGNAQVLVTGIGRDSEGQPIGLTEPVTSQLWAQGEPVDLDWISDTRFVTLTKGGLLGTNSRVTVGSLGNFPTEAGSVNGGISISGGSRSMVRVLDDQRRLYSPQGLTAWQQYQNDIDLLAKVG